VIALLASSLAALGAYLVLSDLLFQRRAVFERRAAPGRARRNRTDWLVQAGLVDVRWREVGLACGLLALVAAGLGYALFGGMPALVLGLVAATAPVLASRRARRHRIAVAQAAWPRLIEEIRVLTASTGMSIPQAVFQVGRRCPAELRDAFAAAQREWLLTTDFARAMSVLKAALADPTADAACETLLIAYSIGGVDVDRRLADLAEDRMADVQGRRDARARQAGARFARVFVLVAPLGMALVGLGIGQGRAAYQTPTGQALVVVGIVLTIGCWVWAGRIMALPSEQRVFAD
jgi:tight adherence protein B